MQRLEENHSDPRIGSKVKILLHLEDHVGYMGQELTIIESLPNDYYMVTDGQKTWCAGIEETDYFENHDD